MKSRKERGQATLEFIVIAPLLLFMVALIAYAGWHSYAKLSAQNAAYGWMIFLPTQELDFSKKWTGGWWGARTETLHEPTGMKSMWDDSASRGQLHTEHGQHRSGGESMTIWVFPGEISLLLRGEVGRGDAESWVPKGTAFFHYAPLRTYKPDQ